MAEHALVDVLAAGVLGVALFCAGRIVLGAMWRRAVERDVDTAHVMMGVSMAGMLTGWRSGSWADVCVVAFSASTCWFAWRTRSDGGHMRHVVASAAMLYMLVEVRWLAPVAAGHSSGTAMGSMGSMSAYSSGAGAPVLAFVVAGLLVLDASIVAARALRRGAVAYASGPGGAAPVTDNESCVPGPRPLAPRGTANCALVMTLAMAYMFVTMHP